MGTAYTPPHTQHLAASAKEIQLSLMGAASGPAGWQEWCHKTGLWGRRAEITVPANDSLETQLVGFFS